MTEYKPCPECGSDNLNIMTEFISGIRTIYCLNCNKYYDQLELTRKDTRSDIIEKWNEYVQNYKPEPKTEPALKPCPFCGSKCIILIKPDYYSDDDWVAKCDNCGANVYDIDEEEVIKTWNRRMNE